MSDNRKEDIKSSSKIVPSTNKSQNEIGEQIIFKNKVEVEQIKYDIDKLHKEVDDLKKDKTPYGVIMKSPVIFVCGLFIGVLVMGFMLWTEKQERKELRKELIEYVDKMFTRTGTIGEMMYKDMQANQQNTQESKPKDDGVVDGDFKDLNK